MFVRQWCERCGATTEVVVRDSSVGGETSCPGCGAPTSVRMTTPRGGLGVGIDFALAGEKQEGSRRPSSPATRLEALRQIDNLVNNLRQSIQRLKGTLTPEEERHVLQATEHAKTTRGEADLGQLLNLLTDLANAARVVAYAITRP